MFVQDVENAAPGDQLARGINRDSGADAVLGVQRISGAGEAVQSGMTVQEGSAKRPAAADSLLPWPSGPLPP